MDIIYLLRITWDLALCVDTHEFPIVGYDPRYTLTMVMDEDLLPAHVVGVTRIVYFPRHDAAARYRNLKKVWV
jgi:hypothetical protein